MPLFEFKQMTQMETLLCEEMEASGDDDVETASAIVDLSMKKVDDIVASGGVEEEDDDTDEEFDGEYVEGHFSTVKFPKKSLAVAGAAAAVRARSGIDVVDSSILIPKKKKAMMGASTPAAAAAAPVVESQNIFEYESQII